ncbi:unnamed protein product [Effrenium voratum]|uniref:Brix domain-containing protein n=1 Tax=Effrenium voratum TaxID=2562239 RepID=A0AA36I606_9DINO|nr:unnamed protein product [Effrenium voratum]CAJ1428124.1 unnamed protein product [Effrenium voratum]
MRVQLFLTLLRVLSRIRGAGDPRADGRTITFHNQRDFVFFRHYRYNFSEEGTKCKLQEIGPRFTMKCRYLQHGTFDAIEGEYEYIWRPDSQVSRKKFFV